MLFIHPMWDHESERLGKQKCTPTGYTLHVVAELIGFGGLLMLFVLPIVLAWKVVVGRYENADLWVLVLPFGVGVVSEVMFQFSWSLARRKGFHYDPHRCEASWLEAGERRTYKFSG